MSQTKPIYIHSAAALGPNGDYASTQRQILASDPQKHDLRELTKSVCGHPLRQASHLVQLAVISATLCIQRLKQTPTTTSLYVGTGLGELMKTTALFQQVMPPANGMASPFDFINASSNMAAFYVAKSLDTSARNLTLSQDEFSFETALQLAIADLQHGACQQALVGGMDEHVNDRAGQLRRIHLDAQQIIGEGSAWLFLDTHAQHAIGDIAWLGLRPASAQAENWAEGIAQWLGPQLSSTQAVVLLPGFRISNEQIEGLLQQLPITRCRQYLQNCGCFHTAAAFGLAAIFDEDHDANTQFLHINHDTQGRTMAVLVNAYGSRD